MDPVGDTDDPCEVMRSVFGFRLLEAPSNLAGQRDDTLLDLDAYPIGRKTDAPFEDVDGSLGDLVIRGLLV